MSRAFDIVIIGAGVAGLSAAYHLCSQNLKVCLFERQSDFCQGGSGNSQALLNPFLTLLDTPAASFMSDAYAESLNFFKEHKEKIGFNQTGVIHLPVQGKYRKLIEKKEGEGFRAINKEEATNLSGVFIDSETLLYPQSGYLSPRKLAEFYISQSRDRLFIYLNEEAFISNAGKSIIIKSKNHEVETNNVILASAYEASKEKIANKLKLEQVRGEVCFLPITKESSKLKIPLAFNGYIMPPIDGFHLLGSTYDHGEFGAETYFDKQQHLGDRLTKALPSLFSENPVKEKLNGRVSFRTSTHDRLPYIGPLENGVYASLGHGSRGMQTSFYAGKLLANYILSKKAIPEAVLPARLAK